MKTIFLFSFSVAVLLFCTEAYAASPLTPNGILNYVSDTFVDSARIYSEPIKKAAERLFWMLLGIALISTGVRLAFNHGDIASFYSVFVRIILLTGMFYFLLSHGTAIGSSVVDSLSSITNTRGIGPSELLDLTFNTGRALSTAVSKTMYGFSVGITLNIMILIFDIVMFLVTIRYVSLYLTAYIFCICGVFVLGFGAFSYTRELAVNFLRTVFSLSLELMTMILVCNAGFSVLEHLSEAVLQLKGNITLQDTGVVLFTALFIHVLSTGLPRIVGSLIASHPGAGSLSFSIPGIPNFFKRVL